MTAKNAKKEICSDCTNGRRGGKPCPTCNPPGGLLDGVIALGRRTRNAATGKAKVISTDPAGRKTVTTRTSWLGSETTRTTGRKKATAKPKRRR
jgi:hypothetical protein